MCLLFKIFSRIINLQRNRSLGFSNRLKPNEMLIHVQESDISPLLATQQLPGSMCLTNANE